MVDLAEKLKHHGIKEKVSDAVKKKEAEAAEVIKDTSRVQKILDKAMIMCQRLTDIPGIGEYFQDVPLACGMVSDYILGNYKEVPLHSIVMVVAALMYVVSPIDLLPDIIPGIGHMDDAMVLRLVFNAVKTDMRRYEMWRENNRRLNARKI